MNYLWAFMILTGIIYGAFHGTLPQITTAALDSAKEAVTLCITMMGVMSFWVGLMRIAEKAGIIEGLSRRMRPVLHFLFPDLPQEHPANEYIATNMIANVFGQFCGLVSLVPSFRSTMSGANSFDRSNSGMSV